MVPGALLCPRSVSFTHKDPLKSIGMQKQRLATRRCDILVATPGRLLDLLGSTNLAEKLNSIQTIVLDEADRLLDVGFKDTLNSIFNHLPDRSQNPRQCMLYSATLSRDVKEVKHFSPVSIKQD